MYAYPITHDNTHSAGVEIGNRNPRSLLVSNERKQAMQECWDAIDALIAGTDPADPKRPGLFAAARAVWNLKGSVGPNAPERGLL